VNPLNISDAQQYNHSVEAIMLVRAMVDEHARYLSSNTNGTLLVSPSKSICDSLQLSIQYSLPHFLTSSLLLQYGFIQTEEICALMNSPGPITLRRNAIQFPGSDIDLCKWLWEEDGIKAICCCNQLYGTSYNSNIPVITSTHDGSNRYVVRNNLSIPGSILPPNGSIQIILPNDSNYGTTTIERRRTNKSIWSMKGWQNGYFEVQDAGSQIIAQTLEVKPGDSILDYCAGNGGKSFALASVLRSFRFATSHSINDVCHSSSKIVCHDIVDERRRQIRGSLKRVGFTVVRVDESSDTDSVYTVQKHDGSITIQMATSSKLDAMVNSINPHYFDAVLVDAPCSSTGVLRRRPSQRWDITETQVTEILPQLQLDILEKAATFVNPNGGKLVYSTCSLLKEENEDVARKFEQSKLGEGFKRWDFESSNISLVDKDCIDEKSVPEETSLRHTLTILPSENSDGFFIARWKRMHT
jgi:16S rRNA (cytosine967-C5)-methyltransferase